MFDSPTRFQELAYGISAAAISEWCAVDLTTAEAYKSGSAVPSSAAVRLLELHLAGRVVPLDWEGFRFVGPRLIDPHDLELTHGQLRAYSIVWQLARELARPNTPAAAFLDRVAASCSGSRLPLVRRALPSVARPALQLDEDARP